jgi:hypothetical protein
MTRLLTVVQLVAVEEVISLFNFPSPHNFHTLYATYLFDTGIGELGITLVLTRATRRNIPEDGIIHGSVSFLM